jgi:NADPH-dependent 2,4-dienoyl-CoA reductase/sulfur reductase-like enzyme
MSRRLIVIGGVAAGTSAASRARRTDPKLEIILFERGEYISYGACDEPFFLGGEIDRPERLLVRRPFSVLWSFARRAGACPSSFIHILRACSYPLSPQLTLSGT